MDRAKTLRKINEIDLKMHSLLDRLDFNSPRREFLKEFGEDYVEKARQGMIHFDTLEKSLNTALSNKVEPGTKRFTKVLDSYESITSKIKSLGDNFNSFVLSTYLPDSAIDMYVTKFISKPTHRSIPPGNFVHTRKFLPEIDGVSLEDQVMENFKEFTPFVSAHRNTTQHSKTRQSLKIKDGSILLPANTVSTKINNDMDLEDGLGYVFDSYINLAHEALHKMSTSEIASFDSYDKKITSKINKKLLKKDVFSTIKKGIFSLGVISMLAIPSYFVLENISEKNKLELKSSVLELMYNSQDGKKVINITSLANEANTSDLFDSYVGSQRKRNDLLVEELGPIFGSRSRKIFDLFIREDKQEYVSLIKQIDSYRNKLNFYVETRVNENQEDLELDHSNWADPLLEHSLKMSDTLNTLLAKKLVLEKNVIEKISVTPITQTDDPIMQDLYYALSATQRILYSNSRSRGIRRLSEDKLYEKFTQPDVIIGLKNDFHNTMLAVCDELDGPYMDNYLSHILLNNTPYYQHLVEQVGSQDSNGAVFDDLLITKKRNELYPSLSYKMTFPVYERKLSLAPLQAMVTPLIDAQIDDIFRRSYSHDPESEMFFQRYKPGTLNGEKKRLNIE